MKFIRSIASAALVAASLMGLQAAHAQQGFTRHDVLQHDIGTNGQEVVQVRVDFAPGVVSPRHSHPGVEIAYVIEGALEYEIDGKQITLKAGEGVFIPAGAIHVARNVGTVKASELATYVVTKGKPLLEITK